MRAAMLLALGSALLWLAAPLAHGADLTEATTLKDEAVKILQSGSGLATDPKLYAQAVLKLERAMSLIEKTHAEETPLAQEVNSALFWARKFTTVSIIDELGRQKGTGGGDVASAKDAPKPPEAPPSRRVEPVVPPPPPARKVEPADEDDPMGSKVLAAAKKKYQTGEKFAREHKDEDYVVALNWFKVADEAAGTDYAIKALKLAREAQERYAAKRPQTPAPAEVLPDTPEMKLVKEADELAAAANYEGAFAIYRAALAQKETVIAHRKLAHALFNRAQQIKDELMPQFEAAQAEYRTAYQQARSSSYSLGGGTRYRVNWNYPPLVAAKRKGDALMMKANEALRYYDQAYVAFGKVVSMSPGGRDLDAAGHQGLCYSVRGDLNYRMRAKTLISVFLESYKPTNDVERTLYEFCRTELARISGRPVVPVP